MRVLDIVKEWVVEHALLLIVVGCIVVPWWFGYGYLFFPDFVTGPNFPVSMIEPGWMWRTSVKLLGSLVGASIAQRIWLTGLILGLGLLAEAWARRYSQDFWVQKLVGLCLIFNPFVYDRFMYGQVDVVLGFGLLSAGVLVGLNYLTEKSKLSLLGAAGFFGLAVNTLPHMVWLLSALLVLAMIWKSYRWREILILIGVGLVAIVVINGVWLWAGLAQVSQAGQVIHGGIDLYDLVAFMIAGSTPQLSLLNLLTWQGFWMSERDAYLGLSVYWPIGTWLTVASWLIVGAIFALRIKKYLCRQYVLTGLWVVIVLVLALGIGSKPTGGIAVWLFNTLPIYGSMRETQKWVMLILVFWPMVLASALSYCSLQSWWQKWRLVIASGFVVCVVGSTPFMLWGLWGQVRLSDYPQSWYAANELVKTGDNCNGKILFLPWHMYLRHNFTNTVVVNPARRFFDCPVLSGTNQEYAGKYDISNRPDGLAVGEWVKKLGQTNLLTENRYEFKYVFLTDGGTGVGYEWLDELPNLELIQNYGDLKVYEIQK